MRTAVATILENVDPVAVLARYIGEESTKSIAESLGVSRPALTQWLIRVAEDQWKDAQVVKSIEKKERAEDDIDTIAVKLRGGVQPSEVPAIMALHKVAESQLKAAQWDLERTYRRVYGQDAPPNIQVPIQINIGIERNGAPMPPIKIKPCASAEKD